MTPLDLAKQIVAGGPPPMNSAHSYRYTLAEELIRREEGVEPRRYSPGSWQCVACGSLFSNAPNFCGNCGTRLKWPKEEA